MTYEVINPSDMVTFIADDDKVAYVAVILLSEGKYGCKNLDTGENLRCLFLFADETYFNNATTDYLGENLEDYTASHRPELKTALASFAYTSHNERKIYEAAIVAITDPDKLKEFKNKHEDDNRTSLSRIVKRAWQLSDQIEL